MQPGMLLMNVAFEQERCARGYPLNTEGIAMCSVSAMSSHLLSEPFWGVMAMCRHSCHHCPEWFQWHIYICHVEPANQAVAPLSSGWLDRAV